MKHGILIHNKIKIASHCSHFNFKWIYYCKEEQTATYRNPAAVSFLWHAERC